jgi:hypothetical protein
MEHTLDQATGAGHPAPERSHVALAALWFGLFGGPAAWSVQTLLNFSVAAHGCFPRLEPLSTPKTPVLGVTFFVSLGALAVCAAAAVVAVRSWRRTRGEQHRAAGQGSRHSTGIAALETGEGRTRFMAAAGVMASFTFVVVSLIHTAALFLVAPCAS